ncbi:TPA: hypothetical protein ACXI7E_002853 [Pseudomonas aeruginosa]
MQPLAAYAAVINLAVRGFFFLGLGFFQGTKLTCSPISVPC